jgi:hypothetical protein
LAPSNTDVPVPCGIVTLSLVVFARDISGEAPNNNDPVATTESTLLFHFFK